MTLSKPVQSAVSEYLERELPSICEADATALSKYIVALLNRDQSEDELRSSCSSELKEFLGDTTRSFVKRLFDYLRRKKQQLDSADAVGMPTHSGSGSGNGERKRHVEHAAREDDRGHERYPEKRRRERRDRDVHDGYRESSYPRDDRHRRMAEAEHFDAPLRRNSMEERRMPPPQPPPMQQPSHSHRGVPHHRPEPYDHRGMRHESGHGEPRHSPMPARGRDGFQRAFRGGRGGRHSDGGHGRGQRDGGDQRSPTNLFITNIPRQLNNLVSLSSHFSRFGEVVNVQIKPNRDIAFVQFRSHEQAKQALACPDAVCGNRFIKVHWARYDPTDKESVLSTTAGAGEASGADDELKKLEKEAEVRRERKQLDETIAKKLELLRRFRAMAGQNAERDKIIAKTQAEVDEMQTKLASLPEVPQAESAAGNAAADASLKEQLAAAEKEAAKFGLVDEHGNIVSGRGGRGGRAGRGVGGRGARGARGGGGRGRGGGGRGGGARMAMSLDNRTRTLAIKSIKESHCNEKMLRSHLQSFGQIESVEVNAFGANTAMVKFGTRHCAQKAMRHGANMLGNELAISWHEGGAPPEAAAAAVSTAAAPAAAAAAVGEKGAAVPPSVEIVADQSAAKSSDAYDSDEEDNERSWRR